MRAQATGFTPPSRQRGAISVMAAVGIGVMISAALLMVDLGSLFYTQKHLQSVADNAALSAANNPGNAQDIAVDTAAKNDFTVGGGNVLTATPGKYDDSNPDDTTPGVHYEGTFDPTAAEDDWNAVQVTVTTQQPYFFMVGSREITATATAVREDIAGFSIGSGLLSLDTDRSALLGPLLGQLLHTHVAVDAVSYNGLANVNVTLLDLIKAEGNVGTVKELLDLKLTLADIMVLTAKALGQDHVAQVNLLNALALDITNDEKITLGDVLKVDLANGTVAAGAEINVRDLITVAAEVANGKHFLELPVGVNLSDPKTGKGLVKLNLGLTLIEPPSIAIGPPGRDASGVCRTRAHTAQARVKLELALLDVLEPLVGIHVPLYIELARADGCLESIECQMPREDSDVNISATAGLASIYIGNVNADAMTNTEDPATVTPATLLSILKISLLGIDLSTEIIARVHIDVGSQTEYLKDYNPYDDARRTRRIPDNFDVGLDGISKSLSNQMAKPDGEETVLIVKLLGIPLNLSGILDLLMPVLDPVFKLLDAVLAPILSLLGLQLGYADVTNFYLNCGVPRLVR